MDRVAFTIFGLDIMWYGVLMASAMILCVLIALKEAKRVKINEDDILNLAIFAIPCGLVGARLYSNHINCIKSGLLTAYQLREELEQRLSNIKEKSKDFIEQDAVNSNKNNPKINDVVILEESTQFCEEAQKQLNESYTTGYGQKVKRLKLKK